jgi:hypothetical protein
MEATLKWPARKGDHDYQVKFVDGHTVRVYADCYVWLGGLHQFYVGDVVTREFHDRVVTEVKRVCRCVD